MSGIPFLSARRARDFLPFAPVGAALAAARRVQYTFSFDPPRQPAPPWDVPRPRPRPQRFRVGGNANSREAAGAHCAPLRKDGYPMRGTVQARRTKKRYPERRADDIRPYEKTGAQHSGRIISAPTKSGYPVWGTVYVRLTKKRGPCTALISIHFNTTRGAARPAQDRKTVNPCPNSPP